jgi:hypothetical protein
MFVDKLIWQNLTEQRICPLVTATLGRAIVKERFKPKKLNGICGLNSEPLMG